jgi:hypothetical protein
MKEIWPERVITTKFLGATNHKESRIKATDAIGNFVIEPSQYELFSADNHYPAVVRLCQKLEWDYEKNYEIICGSAKSGYVWILHFKEK